MPRSPKRPSMTTLRGIAVSPGLAIAPIEIHDIRRLGLPTSHIEPAQIDAELERLDRGLKAAQKAAEADEADARKRLGPQYADILAAHARMISDSSLRRDARERITSDHLAAEHAVVDVLDTHAKRLEGLDDPYLAARAADVRDIQRRILEKFLGDPSVVVDASAPPHVILAHDLSPSQAAKLDPNHTLGFATEIGGRAGHTAIVAAALEIPAVVGLGPFLESARGCHTAIIDGDDGLVILNPDTETLRRYQKAAAERLARFAGLANLVQIPAQTRDGVMIDLMGNIEFPAESAACRDRGADGIGLYRTEFLYLGADRAPSEDEQYTAYAHVVKSMPDRPVTIRTLDLGADRLVSYVQTSNECRNPSLGLRSIRLSLRRPELFRTQLRAILRASSLGDVRVLFPLISCLSEFRRARQLLQEVADELTAEGVPVRRDLPVGAMIEVPAAVVIADHLAKEVDFFSIGTNDLIQYTLAVDRTDETVADLYSGANPAVLRQIATVIAAANHQGIPVNVCGSMGGDPLYTLLLLGLGMRQLSMPPHQVLEVKRVVRAIDTREAQIIAAQILEYPTTEEVETRLEAEYLRLFPETPPDSQQQASIA